MKSILIVSLFFAGFNSFAGETTFAIEQTWKLIGHGTQGGDCEQKNVKIKKNFHQKNNLSNDGSNFRYLSDDHSLETLESQCSKLIYVINHKRIERKGLILSKYSHTATLITVYCAPRTYSDLALMSLYKNCVNEPKQECFQPGIIEKLDNIQQTEFIEFNTNRCTDK